MKTLGFKTLVLASSLAAASTVALAQSSDIDATTTAAAGNSGRYTVEIKPLPTVLSVVPGIGAIGAGVEAKLSPTTAAFFEASFLSSNLPQRIAQEAKDRSGDDVYPEDITGRGASLGARFYGAPTGHSWYTGAQVGFTSMNGEYSYKDERVTQSTASFTPGLQAGYRWAWQNDVVLRLGAGVASNVIQKHDVTSARDTPDVTEARRKIDERVKTPVVGNVDLGLGYLF